MTQRRERTARLLCVLLFSLQAMQYVSADQLHRVLDVREKMVMDAEVALLNEFAKIGDNGQHLKTVCPDIDEYIFPDMCMPSDEFISTNRVYDEKTEITTTVRYDDDRPKNGKNAPKNLKMNEKYGVETGDFLGYKIQPNTESTVSNENEMCAAKGVGKVFKDHSIGESKWGDLAGTTSWQYFGGQETGMFAQFPTDIKTQCWCDKYDPRYRPWYASAVTGPKDIILVLDVSGSMGDENRLEIMKSAAVAQLDTMTFLDYIQVVQYSSRAQSYGMTLLQGTDKNKKKLKEYIMNMGSGGGTNGEYGVKKAFDIFTNSRTGSTSGCTRIISFLTDGEFNTKDWVDDGTLTSMQNSLGDSRKAHIFTYALGSGARTVELLKMSCNNRGWMVKVPDGKPEQLKRAMVGYYEYFANHIVNNGNVTARWSDFYLDSSGQGVMTTVSLPIFTPHGSYRKFRGVVGIDVLASDFGKNLDDNSLSFQLKLRSQKCQAFNFNIVNPSASIVDQCNFQRLEPGGTMIPTGATIDSVEKDCLGGDFPWWAILLIVLGGLGVGTFLFIVQKKCKKNRNQAPAPAIVEMPAVMVNAVHYNPGARAYQGSMQYGPPPGSNNQYPMAVPHYPAQGPDHR